MSCSQTSRATNCATPRNYSIKLLLQLSAALPVAVCASRIAISCSRSATAATPYSSLYPPRRRSETSPVVTTPLSSLHATRQSASHCHSLSLASSAPGGARKRPPLRHTPKGILNFFGRARSYPACHYIIAKNAHKVKGSEGFLCLIFAAATFVTIGVIPT